MTSDSPTTGNFAKLLEIARESRVQVEFVSREFAPGVDWDGLYLVSPQFGAGIAIRDDLEEEWRDWVLAHELGHHHSKLHGTLFSPFCAHMVDAASRVRWTQAKRLSPEEQDANQWAVTTLVSKQQWLEAEAGTPCDLIQIAAKLLLPPPAAITWERYQRGTLIADQQVLVPLDQFQWKMLRRPVSGEGGHQSYFRRLRRSRDGQSLWLTFRDFSYARERLVCVSGGWQPRYKMILDATEPLILKAGGVNALFRCSFTPLRG